MLKLVSTQPIAVNSLIIFNNKFDRTSQKLSAALLVFLVLTTVAVPTNVDLPMYM